MLSNRAFDVAGRFLEADHAQAEISQDFWYSEAQITSPLDFFERIHAEHFLDLVGGDIFGVGLFAHFIHGGFPSPFRTKRQPTLEALSACKSTCKTNLESLGTLMEV